MSNFGLCEQIFALFPLHFPQLPPLLYKLTKIGVATVLKHNVAFLVDLVVIGADHAIDALVPELL